MNELVTKAHKAALDLDYDKTTSAIENLEFEPVIPQSKIDNKTSVIKNIDCDHFTDYASNCTLEAALIYNSTKNNPPVPKKLMEWCSAIRFRTNCAIDWNSECRELTEDHFYEDNLTGHLHVLEKICEDTQFIKDYSDAAYCIDITADIWESCYSTFKLLVDEQTNISRPLTHYEAHFYLCCARAQFRRCTFDALFRVPGKCTYEHALTMQKFSVTISEGDVFQDCDINVMYINCPGGDPRPSKQQLAIMLDGDGSWRFRSGQDLEQKQFDTILFILVFASVY